MNFIEIIFLSKRDFKKLDGATNLYALSKIKWLSIGLLFNLLF